MSISAVFRRIFYAYCGIECTLPPRISVCFTYLWGETAYPSVTVRTDPRGASRGTDSPAELWRLQMLHDIQKNVLFFNLPRLSQQPDHMMLTSQCKHTASHFPFGLERLWNYILLSAAIISSV